MISGLGISSNIPVLRLLRGCPKKQNHPPELTLLGSLALKKPDCQSDIFVSKMWKLRLLVRIFFTYGKRRFTFTCFFLSFFRHFPKSCTKKHDWKIHKSSQHLKTPEKKNTGHWSSTRTSHDGHDPMFCRRGPWVFSNARQTLGAPQSWELEKKWVGIVGWKKLIIEFFFFF